MHRALVQVDDHPRKASRPRGDDHPLISLISCGALGATNGHVNERDAEANNDAQLRQGPHRTAEDRGARAIVDHWSRLTWSVCEIGWPSFTVMRSASAETFCRNAGSSQSAAWSSGIAAR